MPSITDLNKCYYYVKRMQRNIIYDLIRRRANQVIRFTYLKKKLKWIYQLK